MCAEPINFITNKKFSWLLGILVIFLTACGSNSDAKREAITRYQCETMSLGVLLIMDNQGQAEHYEKLSDDDWGNEKEKFWKKQSQEFSERVNWAKTNILFSKPPPEGCEMIAQELQKLVKISESWNARYSGKIPENLSYLRDFLSKNVFPECAFQQKRFMEEVMKDIGAPAKKFIVGTYKYESKPPFSSVDVLEFRKSGCVFESFIGIPLACQYFIENDKVVMLKSGEFRKQGNRYVFRREGDDLILIEQYSENDKGVVEKEPIKELKRYSRISSTE